MHIKNQTFTAVSLVLSLIILGLAIAAMFTSQWTVMSTSGIFISSAEGLFPWTCVSSGTCSKDIDTWKHGPTYFIVVFSTMWGAIAAVLMATCLAINSVFVSAAWIRFSKAFFSVFLFLCLTFSVIFYGIKSSYKTFGQGFTRTLGYSYWLAVSALFLTVFLLICNITNLFSSMPTNERSYNLNDNLVLKRTTQHENDPSWRP
ncbi:hypothetical protein WR25_14888 [Diploscapter pachys]|uniref:MARVEL domain-containing protein n=1 Tax=Diploscapter pachys TaxID=2018661 RepID=A0A2A2LV05_9BILA|nr:hypothetical protein WR25_14888 [Diploscapter pachys]